jgi:hypothetical protein
VHCGNCWFLTYLHRQVFVCKKSSCSTKCQRYWKRSSKTRNVSRACGFPNNLETYGLISGLWTSTFALGAFVGPSIAGILYDSVGFRNGTMFVVVLNVIVVSDLTTCRTSPVWLAPTWLCHCPSRTQGFSAGSTKTLHWTRSWASTIHLTTIDWGCLGRASGPKRQENGRNCITRSFIICTLCQI